MRHISEFDYVLDHDIWLTPKEYAALIGVNVQSLYNKKNLGELDESQMVTDGFHWFIHRDAQLDIIPRRKRKQED